MTALRRGPTEAIYFFCPQLGPPERTGYPHPMVALAEGLTELGMRVYANVDYWKEATGADGFLFRHDPDVAPADCAVMVMDNSWTYHQNPIPEVLLRFERGSRAVFFDFDDAYPSVACGEVFRAFDFVFRAHWNDRLRYPANFHPWVFGPTKRMLRETQDAPPFAQREKQVLVSYRLGHPVRDLADKLLVRPLEKHLAIRRYSDGFQPPEDEYHRQQWHQTGRRHHPDYYKQLKGSQACACFGGALTGPKIARLTSVKGVMQRLQGRLGWLPKWVLQWDSFRLWESWSAGCATLHLDLELYGARMPVMPGNWKHYIGVDLRHPQRAIDRMLAEPDVFEEVAREGRRWAIENYAPAKVAQRFLDIVFQ